MDTFNSVSSSGDFWKAFRKVTGQGPKPLPTLILSNGSAVLEDSEKATILSTEFSSNFNPAGSPAPNLPNTEPLEADHLCTSDYILDWLMHLPFSMSVGLDSISARFLRGCAADLIIPLRCLLNRCLLEGVFPDEWKMGRIVPIPKLASPTTVSDLRPVSVLPSLSKLPEKWLLSCIYPMLTPASNQFGFWPGRSTEDALAFAQISISQAMEYCVTRRKAVKVAVVSFDISKAFDQISHLKLIEILQRRNVPTPLLRILVSYLSNRTQKVGIGTEFSESVVCTSGIPQGSVLGGPLFNVYIDQVFHLHLSIGSTLVGYADDLLLIKAIPDEAAEADLQLDVDEIVDCYSELLLSVHPAKTRLLVCSIAPQPLSTATPLLVLGKPIKQVPFLKYLGVLLDRKMDLGQNAHTLAVRSRRMLGALKSSCKPLLGTKAFLQIYTAKILPLLLYNIAVTAPSKKEPFCALEKAHRLAARLILNDWSSSYHCLLHCLHWKSISRICFERRCLLVWKYVHGSRHLPTESIVRKKCSERQNRLRGAPHSLDLEILRSKKSSIDLIPFLNCLHTWNVLSPHARSASLPFIRLAVRNFSNYSAVQQCIPTRLFLFDNL